MNIAKYYHNNQTKITNLKEGILMKRGGPLKGWKRRTCVLRNDALYYYLENAKGSQHMKGKIPLLYAKVEDIKIDKPHAFQIVTKTKTYVLCAISAEEKVSWMKHLQDQASVIGHDIDSIVEVDEK